jgi:transposase
MVALKRTTTVAKPLLDDALWERIQPLLPAPAPRRFRFPGRKPLDDRKVLTGILFVLKTGIPWEDLPCEMGCGCGMTCWRRLKWWHEQGVWRRLHQLLLSELRGADKLDWSRAVADSSFARALGGGEKTGPNPTDRSKLGSKHHLLTDGHGIPLAIRLTAANVNEVTVLLDLVDAVPPVAGKPGQPRRRPDSLYADRAYASKAKRRELRRRGIQAFIPEQRAPHGSGLGKVRWVVERSLSWLHGFRKLRLRTDWHSEVHDAFLLLAVSIICFRFL